MRAIKFRAWDKQTNNWLEGVTYTLHTSGRLIVMPPHVKLMQYTGLHDKQGKEIYEGDIVRYRHYNDVEVCYLVEYKEAGFYPFMDIWSGTHTLDGFEVIGNIYETPELLEATA